ncbi:MAG: hypothetical protein JW882_10075 [Deltaproteobacteria bacterium]|nr:hypothetical protein [Deltaproteobacteria bacterium]
MMQQQIEEAKKIIAGLAPNEMAEFREWFADYDAAEWDKQFEDDVKAGRLDAMGQHAIEDYKKGNCREL